MGVEGGEGLDFEFEACEIVQSHFFIGESHGTAFGVKEGGIMFIGEQDFMGVDCCVASVVGWLEGDSVEKSRLKIWCFFEFLIDGGPESE